MDALAGESVGKPATLWGKYVQVLEARPLPTKVVTAGFLAAAGDIVAQTMLPGHPDHFSMQRLLNLVVVNMIYIAPILHFWYGLFDHVVTKVLRLKRPAATAALVCLDQLVNAPITLLGFFGVYSATSAIILMVTDQTFFGLTAIVDGALSAIHAEFWSGLIANWKVWVLPQVFNFAVVPPQLRVGFASLIAIVWNMVLSIIANK